MSIITKPKPGFLINPLHPFSQDLVAWWLFNEGTGFIIRNYRHSTDTVARDLRGDFAGTFGPDIWQGSIHGGGCYFNGSNQVNFNTNEIGTVLNGASGVTVAAWINYDALSGRILTVFGSASNVFINLTFASSDVSFTVRPVLITAATATATTSPSAGTWVHAVGTCEFAEDFARLYLNGQLAATDSQAFGSSVWVQGNASSVDAIASVGYSGFVDDIRIFRRALSADDVRMLYGNPYDNVLTNRFPKFVQTIQSGLTAPSRTSRPIIRRRLLRARF